MLDRNTIIRILFLIAVMLSIVMFAPKNAGYAYTSDITVIDHYSNNILGFEFATDIVVFHDNKRNATCWTYNYEGVGCLSDKDLN
jgi:hypothetical protein